MSLKYCHYRYCHLLQCHSLKHSTVTIVLSLTTSLSRKEIRPNPGPKKNILKTIHTLYHRVGFFKAHPEYLRVSPEASVALVKRISKSVKTIKKRVKMNISGNSKKAPPQKKNMPRDSPCAKTLILSFWKSCAVWFLRTGGGLSGSGQRPL